MNLEIMAQILLTLISVGASTLCAYLIYCLQERNKRREVLEREREHEYREAQAKQENEYAALRKGVCAVLRDRIVQSAIYFRSQGYANAAQKTTSTRCMLHIMHSAVTARQHTRWKIF